MICFLDYLGSVYHRAVVGYIIVVVVVRISCGQSRGARELYQLLVCLSLRNANRD